MRIALVALLTSVFVVPATARSVQLNAAEGIVARMDVPAADCPAQILVAVEAKADTPAVQLKAALPKIVAWALVNAQMACPGLTSIAVHGRLGGQKVYDGVAQRTHGWILAESAPAGAAGGALKAIDECDAAAAHRDDPEAIATGVSDAALDARTVIAACEAATRLDDKAPRLRFQLARGLLRAGRFEDAVAQLIEAADQGHGGSLAYLADAQLEGTPGLPADPAAALALYQRAAAAGFEPAQAMVAQFEDKTAQFQQAEKEERDSIIRELGFTPTKYVYPDIVTSIYLKEFEAIRYNEKWVKTYLANLAENIGEICEAHFAKAEYKVLHTAAAMHGEEFSQEAGQLAMTDIIIQLGTLMKDPMGEAQRMAKNEADWDALPDEALKDSVAIIKDLQCGGENLEIFSRHVRAFIQSEDAPIQSKAQIAGACAAAVPNSRQTGYCLCFVGAMRRAGISRHDRLLLSRDFIAGARALRQADSAVFGACGRV